MTIDGVMAAILWGGVFLILYTWVIFPLGVALLARVRRRAPLPTEPERWPTLSVIIAAYNEEASIAARIENLREQDYPADRIEVIVASDGSGDRTVEIARGFPEVKVLAYERNRGKASVHNDAVLEASGEILVFSDAETLFESDFLRRAVSHLTDPAYGGGAGDYTFRPLGSMGESENLYWRMEKAIRRAEYAAGCLPFTSGGCFLMRRELYMPIPPHSDIDNLMPLHIIASGKRVFHASDAKAYDVTVADAGTHFRKRLRTAQRSFTDMVWFLPRLWRAGAVGIIGVVVSHRFIRWFTGWLWLLVLLANVALVAAHSADGGLWSVLLAMQLAALTFCGVGRVVERQRIEWIPMSGLARAAYSFLLAITAFSIAVLRAARGQRIERWTTRT
ncbi:glycosyltransferase family 2 protein [Endothiovibrio diazotrophicus]